MKSLTEAVKVLCSKCDGPGGHLDGLCIRCKGIELNEKCGKCGSPWIYIHAFMNDKKPRVPMCKPCCYSYIRLCGFMDDVDTLTAARLAAWNSEKQAALKPIEAEPDVKTVKDDGQNHLTFTDA